MNPVVETAPIVNVAPAPKLLWELASARLGELLKERQKIKGMEIVNAKEIGEQIQCMKDDVKCPDWRKVCREVHNFDERQSFNYTRIFNNWDDSFAKCKSMAEVLGKLKEKKKAAKGGSGEYVGLKEEEAFQASKPSKSKKEIITTAEDVERMEQLCKKFGCDIANTIRLLHELDLTDAAIASRLRDQERKRVAAALAEKQQAAAKAVELAKQKAAEQAAQQAAELAELKAENERLKAAQKRKK